MVKQLFKITIIMIILLIISLSITNINNQMFAQEGKLSLEEAKKLGISEDQLKGWNYFTEALNLSLKAKTDADYDKAIEKFKEVIRIDPTRRAGSYGAIGEAYARKSLFHKGRERKTLQAKAEKYWKKAITLDPRYIKISELSKKHYTIFPTEEEERREEAEKYCREGSITGGFAMLENNEAKYKEGIKLLKKAIKIDPEYVEPYLELARIYYHRDMNSQAETYWKKALKLDPNSIEGHLSLADYYRWEGQPKRAKKEYQKVLKLDPNNKDAQEGLEEVESKIATMTSEKQPAKFIVIGLAILLIIIVGSLIFIKRKKKAAV